MLEKLQIIQQRFDEVSDLIIQPEVISDQKRYIQLNKEYKDLSVLMERIKTYRILISNFQEAEQILKVESDEEMIAMAKMEMDEAKESINKLEDEIKFLLIPKDPEDAKNVVIEIRAGTGGDEASIFAGDLYRMYTKYSQSQNWRVSFVDSSEGTAGGFKEIIFEVSGEDVYGTMKYESGVHRVQRVPQTETAIITDIVAFIRKIHRSEKPDHTAKSLGGQTMAQASHGFQVMLCSQGRHQGCKISQTTRTL